MPCVCAHPSKSRRGATRVAGIALGLAAAGFAPALPAGDRDALRHIVQEQCMPHWREQHDATPCVRIAAPDFAVLADQKGGAHFLLIATQTVSGIEDPKVLDPHTPNYFAAAWQARDRLAAVMGHAVGDEAIGLAVNSAVARGQDQLHIHIECLQPALQRTLRATGDALSDHWAPLPSAEFPYQAMRVPGNSLDRANPFLLLADAQPGARENMGAYTIVVAGARFRDGPGFIVLAGRTPRREAMLLPRAAGLVPPGESVLDSTCTSDR